MEIVHVSTLFGKKTGDIMQRVKRYIFVVSLALFGMLPATIFAGNIQPCGSTSIKTGKTYKVSGSNINVRTGPGTNFKKIINQKATNILKKTHYIAIDKSVTVYEECTQGTWSKIQVTDPDWLSQSHRGWVASRFLQNKRIDSSGNEIFTEANFLFDKNTRPYKNIIMAGVNKIHRENGRCGNIDPSSAYISNSKGSKTDPVFFVTCGKGSNVFNVFFSKSDIIKDKKFQQKKHISKSKATDLCEKYAKLKAAHPDTVIFSRVMDLTIYETPNGRTRLTSTFTAKNSFNLELKNKISCLFNSYGLIEANISEAR